MPKCGVTRPERLISACTGLQTVDLSHNANVTDEVVCGLATCCGQLKNLRVAVEGARSIVHNCWALEFLCFDDVYRLNDSAFIVDSSVDSRQYVEVNMLGCSRISRPAPYQSHPMLPFNQPDARCSQLALSAFEKNRAI